MDTLLNKKTDKPIIEINGRRITQKEFSDRVFKLIEKLDAPSEGASYLINTEDPFDFYTLLFLLWRKKMNVIFPTKDHFSDKENFPHYNYSIHIEDEELIIRENKAFQAVKNWNPKYGDTIVFSSGSTGTPKGIAHARNHFLENARETAKLMGIKNFCGLTMLKPYLVSALSHFLVFYLTDSLLIFTDLERSDQIGEIAGKHKNMGMVGSPIHIMIASGQLPPDNPPAFFFTSGDFVYQNTISKILEKYPQSVFFKVYGLAELAGRAFVNRIDSSTPLENIDTVGTNIGSIDFTIQDEEILVTSSTLFSGYIRNSAFEQSSSPHRTGDKIKSDRDQIVLVGRTDDEIKVGGNKVSLKHIEKKISQALPETVLAVFPKEHPTFGNLICLIVEGTDKLDRAELITKLRTHLTPNEMPHKYYQAEQLYYTQTMKIDRKAIARNLDKFILL